MQLYRRSRCIGFIRKLPAGCHMADDVRKVLKPDAEPGAPCVVGEPAPQDAAQEALRMSDERFTVLVESISDYAIFILDPMGRVLTWNTGARRIKGYLPDQIIGRHFSVFYTEEARQNGWPEYELKTARQEGRFEDEGWRVRSDVHNCWASWRRTWPTPSSASVAGSPGCSTIRFNSPWSPR